ncbi:hypothetical protein BDA99DRAFT_526874 [Phascolomyces articulosus]|uniref:Cysteine-rich transmembrane CYSTM domain-containing protein n=1 Tax=Phascolomyces articulosus TaxID=60185 RepID=A0AAD5P7W0_9FUNG|nr:hypothetical protein BDA99DRAFT_526874 [Phascolomyces articulosus]
MSNNSTISNGNNTKNTNKRNSLPEQWAPSSPTPLEFEPWGKKQHPTTPHIYYEMTPAPQTVIVRDTPSRTKDACCWGCLAAICLCFGIKECCTT